MVKQTFMQRCLLQRPTLKKYSQCKFLVKTGSRLRAYSKNYIRLNIYMIRTLTGGILLSSFAGFSVLRRICCIRIIVSFGIPDNDSVVWFINIGCLLQGVSRFDLPSIKFLMYYYFFQRVRLVFVLCIFVPVQLESDKDLICSITKYASFKKYTQHTCTTIKMFIDESISIWIATF